MKKLSMRGLVLFGALSLSAVAMPSMASATGWDPGGATVPLTSQNLSITVPAANFGLTCLDSHFHADVVSNLVLTVTSATFSGCTGTGNGTGCTTTLTATNLDWVATGLSTTNVTIDRVDVDVRYEGSCVLTGQTVRLTGGLSGGMANNATHSVTYSGDTGLIAHSALGSFAAQVSGTLRDLGGNLTFTD